MSAGNTERKSVSTVGAVNATVNGGETIEFELKSASGEKYLFTAHQADLYRIIHGLVAASRVAEEVRFKNPDALRAGLSRPFKLLGDPGIAVGTVGVGAHFPVDLGFLLQVTMSFEQAGSLGNDLIQASQMEGQANLPGTQ